MGRMAPVVPAFQELTVFTREKTSWSQHPDLAPSPRILLALFASFVHPSPAVSRDGLLWLVSLEHMCLPWRTHRNHMLWGRDVFQKEGGWSWPKNRYHHYWELVFFFFLRQCRSVFMGVEALEDGERPSSHQIPSVLCAENPFSYHSDFSHFSELLTTWGE